MYNVLHISYLWRDVFPRLSWNILTHFYRSRFFICQASGMFVSLPMTYDDATLWWRVITLRKRNVSLQLEPAKFKVNNDKEETRRL